MDAVPDAHSAKTMTEEQDDEQTIEVSYEKYDRLMDAFSQVNAEGWIPVLRHDEEPVEARPVDRQDERAEGARIYSDQWLIRDHSGETYTVNEHTFEERYEMQGEYRTEKFLVDLSWTDDDYETPEDAPDDVDIEGWTIVAEVVAHIHVPTQTVRRFLITRCDLKQSNYTNMDGIPVELLHDSPQFSTVEDSTEDEDQDNE